MREHPSIPCNPDVATVFFRAGMIEAWGRGTLMILDACQKAHLPSPVFSSDSNGFGIVFKAAMKKTSGKTSGKIMEIIKANPYVTIPEMAEKIGVTERSIERNLQSLQKTGLLERIGPAKGGHWKLLLPDLDGESR